MDRPQVALCVPPMPSIFLIVLGGFFWGWGFTGAKRGCLKIVGSGLIGEGRFRALAHPFSVLFVGGGQSEGS
jgi:uncharacterized protein YqgC (DUF456 family)